MAADVLTELSKSEEERIQYENELIYELDVNTRIYYAEKAAAEAAAQTATKAVKKEKNLQFLELIRSGYSLEEIEEKLQKEINESNELKPITTLTNNHLAIGSK